MAAEPQNTTEKSQAERRARALPGLATPEDEGLDVEPPEWAAEYSVDDEIAFEGPDGTQTARVLGFSVRIGTRGLPGVLMPENIQKHYSDDVDILVLREEDVVGEV